MYNELFAGVVIGITLTGLLFLISRNYQNIINFFNKKKSCNCNCIDNPKLKKLIKELANDEAYKIIKKFNDKLEK